MSQRNPIVIEDSDSDDNNPIGVSTRQNCHNEAPEPHRPDPDKKKKKRWKPVPAVEDSDNHIESIHARKRPQLRPRQGMMSLPLAQRRSLHLGSISSSSSDSQDLINTSHSKSYSDHPPLSGDPVAMHLRRPDYRARQYGNTVQLMSKAERQEFLSRKHYESLKNQVPQYGRNTGVSNQGRGERREEAYTGTATMSATMSATAEPGSTIIHAPARLPPFSSHQQLPLSPTTLTHAPHEAANLLWQRHCNSTARPQLINVNKEHKVGDEFSTDSAHEESVKNKTLATHKAPLERVEEEEEYKTGAVDESHAVSYVNAEKSVDLTWDDFKGLPCSSAPTYTAPTPHTATPVSTDSQSIDMVLHRAPGRPKSRYPDEQQLPPPFNITGRNASERQKSGGIPTRSVTNSIPEPEGFAATQRSLYTYTDLSKYKAPSDPFQYDNSRNKSQSNASVKPSVAGYRGTANLNPPRSPNTKRADSLGRPRGLRDTVKSPYFQNQDSSQTKLKDRLKSEARSDPYHDVEEIEDDGPLPYSLRNGRTTRKRAQVTSSHLSPDADSQSIRITNVAGLGLFGGGQHNSAISKEVDPPVKTYAITFAHSQHHTIGDEEDVSQDDKQEGAGTEAALKKKDLLYHPTGKAFYFYVNGKYASDDGYGIEGYTSFCINPDTATQTVVSKNKTDNKLIVRRKEGDLLLKLQSQLPVSFASDIRNRNPEITIRQVSKKKMQETWDHILHDKGKMFDERNGAGYCIDEVNVAEDIRLMRWNRDSRLRSQSTADKTQRRPPKADGSLARPDFEPAPKPVRKPTVKTDPRPDPRPRRRVDDEPSQKPETESSHKPEDEPRAQPKIRTKLKTIQTTSKAHAQDFKKWLKKWERYGQDDAVWYRPDGSRKVLAKIDRQAVKSLGPRMWLNDDVINFWTGYSFEQLKKRDPQAAARFYIGSHYIASTAQQPEHRFYLSRVKQEAQNNIFDVDYFVVPEQKTGHWTIAVACNPRSLLKNATPKAGAVADGQFRIVTLDSLYQGPTGYILAKRVHKFLVDVAKEQGQAIEEKFDDEYHVCFQEAPDQGDSYNCGVFAVWFIEIIMNDPDMILSSIIEDRDDHMSSFMDLNANAKRHEMMEVIEGLNIQKLRKAHDDRQYPTAKPVAKHGSGEREAQLLCHDGCNQPYDPELGSKLKCGHKILLDCLKRAVSDGIIKSTNNCPLCDSGDLVKVCIVCRRRIDGPALEKGPGYMLKSGHYVHNDCRLTVEDLDHSFPDERKEFEKRGKVSEPPQDGEGIVDVKESEVDRDGNMITEEELTPLEKSENEVSEPMETDADLTSHEQIEYKAPEQRPHKGLAMLGLGEQDSDGEIVQIGGAEEPMDYIPFDPSQSTVEDPEEERVKLTGTILDSLEDHDADDVSEGGRQGDGDENNDGGENNDGNTLTLRGGAEPFQDLLAMHATDADSDVEMTDLGLAHSNHSQNILSGGLAEMMDVVRTSPPRHMPIRSSPTSRKRFSPLQIEIHEDAPATHVSSPISPRAKRQRLFAGSASSPARPHTRTQFAAASPPLRTRLSPRSPAAAARPVAVTPTQIQPVKRKRERDGDKIVIPGERRSTRRKGRHVSEPIELD